jgi:hypothetical protein
MGRTVGAAMLLVLLLAGCSAKHPETAGGEPPEPSPVGAPAGDVVSASLGAAGGTVSSTDGRISVTIPAGALTADTPIGIQPITNTAGAGLDAAYRLSPAGQTFAKPVTLTFPYRDTDLDGTFADALGVVFQNGDGRWERPADAVVDTAAKRVTVASTHFSDWSLVAGVQLLPRHAAVKLKGKVALKVTDCWRVAASKTFYRCADVAANYTPPFEAKPDTWAVDGAPAGTTATGLVSGNTVGAVYTAPDKKPTNITGNQVAVSVQVKHSSGIKLIVSNIKILSGYLVVGDFTEVSSAYVGCPLGSPKVTDKLSFELVPNGDGYLVDNIKNFDSAYALPPSLPGGMTQTVVSKVDVFEATSGKVTAFAGSDTIVVELNGGVTYGVCRLSNGVEYPGFHDDDGNFRLTFNTAAFPDSGVQKDLVADSGRPHWLWTMSEQ